MTTGTDDSDSSESKTEDSTKILLVEDNLADLRHAEALLPPPTYTLLEAATLAQALDLIKDKQVDVVLVNMSLPDSKGLDTVARLLSEREELPIVVLSELENIACAIKAVRAGAHDYIVKTELSAELLTQSIAEAIEAKKRQRQKILTERKRFSLLAATLAQTFLQLPTLQEVSTACIDLIIAHFNAADVRIWIVDDLEQALVLQSSSQTHALEESGHARIPIDDLTSRSASEQKLQFSDFMSQDHRIRDPVWASREGMEGFAGFPLLVGDRLVGLLSAFARQPFGVIALSELSAVATQIALGIDVHIAEEARALLSSIVNCSEDGIISKSIDGEILSWNPAAERIFGFSAAEMIGQSISLLMPSAGVDEFPRIMEKLKRGEYIEHYETTRLRKDGDLIDVSLTLSPIKDVAGTVTGASSIIRDVTKRKRSERLGFAQNTVNKALSASETIAAAAGAIVEVVSKAIPAVFGALWCLDTDRGVLRCVDVWHEADPTFVEMVAVSKSANFFVGSSLPGRVLASGKPAWVPDLEADGHIVRLHAAIKGGLSCAFGFPILLGPDVLGVLEFFARKGEEPDDELLAVMANIGAQVGQFIDRKHGAELTRRANEARIRIVQAIVELAPTGIAWLDKDFVISEANDAFAGQFGVDRKSLPGKCIFQIATGIPDERLRAVLENGFPFSATNFRIAISGANESRESFCDLIIWPVMDEEHRPTGLVILTVDVTERVKLARQREDFVATLSHDLKNPLIGQRRILGLILEGKLGPVYTDQAPVFSMLKTGTDEMLDLIGILLEVYRYEAGMPQLHIEEVDAKLLISGCIEQLKPIAEAKGIVVKMTLPEGLHAFIGDQLALRRVVMNLLDNAVKFSPDGEVISVSCHSIGTDTALTIADNGPGIPPGSMPSLFQRFMQIGSDHTRKAGTGLGLYLCRQIVEAHGGKISCESDVGAGAKFVVTLPAALY